MDKIPAIESRQISAKVSGAVASVRVMRGCSQVGGLLPLLWTMVVEDLPTRLNRNGLQALGYADDLFVIIRGKHDQSQA